LNSLTASLLADPTTRRSNSPERRSPPEPGSPKHRRLIAELQQHPAVNPDDMLSKMYQENYVLQAQRQVREESEARSSVYRAMGLTTSGGIAVGKDTPISKHEPLQHSYLGLSKRVSGGKTVSEMQAELAKLMAAGIVDNTGRKIA